MTGSLELTERIWTKDGIREITEADKETIQQQNRDFSMEGLRVLAFTYREIPEEHVLTAKDEDHLVFLGLIAMMDPPREESKARSRGMYQSRNPAGHDYRRS